ncbi:MAG: hypothetical protein LBP22_12115 [Deltaproteobacteria bacterium]|nr:hypothetical protein [Deltaproteobacteria bacterium]
MPSENEMLALLAEGLEAASRNQAALELGDRSSYLGLSDLAGAMSCPRTVILNKVLENRKSQSLRNLLQLSRGHWLESGIERSLENLGVSFIRQMEIAVQHEDAPIKAHLDLVIPGTDSNSVTVLEIKSAAKSRDCVYESHEAQLYGQLGLLAEYWSEPVFTACGTDDAVSFPELASKHLHINLPDSPDTSTVSGFVLTVSPNDARAFGPYFPNRMMLDMLLTKASSTWSILQEIKAGIPGVEDIPYQKEFSPLCDYCGFNHDCPKFKGDSCDGLAPDLEELIDLKARRNSLDDQIKDREDTLKSLASRLSCNGRWISADSYRFKVTEQKGRSSLDRHLLQENLSRKAHLEDDLISEVVSSSFKQGKPFQRLCLSPVN